MSVHDTTIPETMSAVRCLGIKDYCPQTVEAPSEGALLPGELILKVTRCGICAGDKKCFNGAPRFWGDETQPQYVQTPVTPGHEFCGVIAASRRKGFEVGEEITAENVVACRECLYCQKGLRWLCEPHDIFGFHTNVDGGVAEYMKIPVKAIVHKFPKGMSVEDMVLAEPLSCSVHGVERGELQLGDVVVVGGCGPIGLGMVCAARKRGPARLIAVDMNEKRLDIARECGADMVINGSTEDVVQTVKEMTGGYGCDVYLEASGDSSGVVQGLMCLRKAGTMVEFSVFEKPTVVDWTVVGDTKEMTIKGGHCSGDKGYEVAIGMLASGNIPSSRIVTHSVAIDEAVDALQLVGGGDQSVKVTVDPQLRQ